MSRLASLAVALAACSSPASTPASTTTKPDDDVNVPIDAAAEVVQAAPDAAPAPPPVPASTCIPGEAVLTAYVDDALVMCAETCFAVTSDGTTTEASQPPATRSITITDAGTEVIACRTPDTCASIKPNIGTKKLVVVAAAFDEAGSRVAVVTQDAEHFDPGTLELWDLEKVKRLAHGSAGGEDPGGVEYRVGFVGDVIVSVGRGKYESTFTTLSKLSGSKLKRLSQVTGQGPGGWAALDDGNVAILRGDTVSVADIKTGKTIDTWHWTIPRCAS